MLGFQGKCDADTHIDIRAYKDKKEDGFCFDRVSGATYYNAGLQTNHCSAA